MEVCSEKKNGTKHFLGGKYRPSYDSDSDDERVLFFLGPPTFKYHSLFCRHRICYWVPACYVRVAAAPGTAVAAPRTAVTRARNVSRP